MCKNSGEEAVLKLMKKPIESIRDETTEALTQLYRIYAGKFK